MRVARALTDLFTEVVRATGLTAPTLRVGATLAQLAAPTVADRHAREAWSKEVFTLLVHGALGAVRHAEAIVDAGEPIATIARARSAIAHRLDADAITTHLARSTGRIGHAVRATEAIRGAALGDEAVRIAHTALRDAFHADLLDASRASAQRVDALGVGHAPDAAVGHIEVHIGLNAAAKTRDALLIGAGAILTGGALHGRRRAVPRHTLGALTTLGVCLTQLLKGGSTTT